MRAKANDFAARLAPTLMEMREQGLNPHRMAAELTARSIPSPRGGAWTATSLRRVLARV
jgi:hypothetical protein